MKLKIGLNAGTLFVVFLVLKLTGYITWSWWWVTAPLWIPFALVGIAAAFVFFVLVIAALMVRVDTSRRGW